MSVYGFSPGYSIYKYKLVKVLGSSQADVWLATDQTTNTEVALKVMHVPQDAISGQPDFASRLYEAKVGALLRHNNLCEVKYADVVNLGTPGGNAPFVVIAFEFIPNGTCLSMLEGPGIIPAEKVRKLLIDVLSGLEYLHGNGIFHNDIKPANILVGHHGQFLLTDYGIACSPKLGSVTAQFYVPHIAPESIQSGSHVPSVQTEIYQLSATAHRLLNGGDSLRNKLLNLGDAAFKQKVLMGELPDREGYVETVPNSLKRIINRGLDLNPNTRFLSARDMRYELEKLHFQADWQYDIFNEPACEIGNGIYKVKIVPEKKAFNVICTVTNRHSGITTHVRKHCHAGLTKAIAEKTRRRIMQKLIVEGNG